MPIRACGEVQVVDAALNGVVVAVRCGGEAVLAVGTGWRMGTLRRLDRRRRGLSKGRMQLLVVPRPLRFIVNVCVVDQRDVVDVVIDEKLGVRHEVVDGIPGRGFLYSVIKGATERFHHPHLHGNRGDEVQRERQQSGRSEVRERVETEEGGSKEISQYMCDRKDLKHCRTCSEHALQCTDSSRSGCCKILKMFVSFVLGSYSNDFILVLKGTMCNF